MWKKAGVTSLRYCPGVFLQGLESNYEMHKLRYPVIWLSSLQISLFSYMGVSSFCSVSIDSQLSRQSVI